MAKKITKKPTAKKIAATKKPPSASKKIKEKKLAVPKTAPLSYDQIGQAAGRIWGTLADESPLSLTALKKALGGSPETTLMAIGWLAREGKLNFQSTGRSVKVSLR